MLKLQFSNWKKIMLLLLVTQFGLSFSLHFIWRKYLPILQGKKKEFQVSEMTFPLTETDNIGKSTSLQRERRGETKSSGRGTCLDTQASVPSSIQLKMPP